MVKDIGAQYTFEKNKLDSSQPLIWLYEVQTKADPPTMIRLTNQSLQVVYQGNAYYPAPITHGGVGANAESDLDTVQITLGNASLEVAQILESSDGLIGQLVRISVVPESLLETSGSAVSYEGNVVSTAMGAESLTITVGARNAFKAGFPPFRYTRRKCRWLFGSVECGVTLAGFSLTECPGYTLTACRQVGDAEVADGRPRLHPLRFGGYPAIPKTRSF
jgi:phage-related protein